MPPNHPDTDSLVSGKPHRVPRAAYVHVPFCGHHCGYCNFSVLSGRDDLLPAYLSALGRELSSLEETRVVDTLYVGGGSPTHPPLAGIEELWRLLRRWFSPPNNDPAQWDCTVEANPGEFTDAHARLLVDHGVNRISLGIQSFQASKLKRLDRRHLPEDIPPAWNAARNMPASVGADLIFAAPQETIAEWDFDLGRAMALGFDHISTYGLTFEKGTLFWNQRLRGGIVEVDEEMQRTLYLRGIDTLEAAGYDHYEVSNFARAGHASRHNQVYWQGAAYWGFGPGAARYVDGRREANHRSTTTYLRRVLAGESATAESETLDPEQRARERLVFGLRMRRGVDR
ncbi:MAG TPA: radical SAM family heme chaperone HemW, partial [Pirellulaceae bacterium]